MKSKILPEDKIKEAILHPNSMVRNQAISYFAESFSHDSSIMPLAIQTITKWGWDKAFESPTKLFGLIHNKQSVRWLINEFKKYSYVSNPIIRKRAELIERMISWANLDSLSPYSDEFLAMPTLDEAIRINLKLRLQHKHQLEELAIVSAEKYILNVEEGGEGFNHDHFTILAEAVARSSKERSDTALRWLLPEFIEKDISCNYAHVAFAVLVAGYMRDDVSTTSIVDILFDDKIDVDKDDCDWALRMIGGNSAVACIEHAISIIPSYKHMLACLTLDRIRTDMSHNLQLKLFDVEQHIDNKLIIAQGIVANYVLDSMDKMVEFARYHPPHRELNGLRERIVAVAPVLNYSFPEYDDWLRDAKKSRKDLQGFIKQQILELATNDVPEKLPVKRTSKNATCPCGSGKKFKRCCGRQKT